MGRCYEAELQLTGSLLTNCIQVNRRLTIDYTDFCHPALSGGLYAHVGGSDKKRLN